MRSDGVQRRVLHRRRAVTSLTQNLDVITGSQEIQASFFYYYTLITVAGTSEGLQKRLSII